MRQQEWKQQRHLPDQFRKGWGQLCPSPFYMNQSFYLFTHASFSRVFSLLKTHSTVRFLRKAFFGPQVRSGCSVFSHLLWTCSRHYLLFHFVYKVIPSRWSSFLELPTWRPASPPSGLYLQSHPPWGSTLPRFPPPIHPPSPCPLSTPDTIVVIASHQPRRDSSCPPRHPSLRATPVSTLAQ